MRSSAAVAALVGQLMWDLCSGSVAAATNQERHSEEIRDLYSAYPDDRRSKSPFVQIWKYLRLNHLDTLVDVVTVPTGAVMPDSNGDRFVSKILVPIESSPHYNTVQQLGVFIRDQMKQVIYPPKQCEPSEVIACCTLSPTRECLLEFPLHSERALAAVVAFAADTMRLIAIELLRDQRTSFVNKAWLRAGKLVGDAVFFAWPVEGGDDQDEVLLTRVDAGIVERLVATITPLQSLVSDGEPPQSEKASGVYPSYSCASSGMRFVTMTPPNPIGSVSTGTPSTRRSATITDQSYIDVGVSQGEIVLTYREREGSLPPSLKWNDFVAMSVKTGAFRRCFGDEANDLFTKQPGVFPEANDRDVSVFLFYVLYGQGLLDQGH